MVGLTGTRIGRMDSQEQRACKNWANTLMAEHHGKAHSENIGIYTGEPSVEYNRIQWESTFREVLDLDTANKICHEMDQVSSIWHIWPTLTEAELGKVMKAGAVNF